MKDIYIEAIDMIVAIPEYVNDEVFRFAKIIESILQENEIENIENVHFKVV